MGAIRPVRRRVCSVCGIEEFVRSDNQSSVCKGCAARIRGAKGVESIKRRAEASATFCPVCEKRKRRDDTYCSVVCRMADSKVARVCKTCGEEFHAYKSSLSGKTNASGNYCSRECYERVLCKPDRVSGRGSRWRAVRDSVINASGFCAICGTTIKPRLQVHHITPFRMTRDNNPKNLIPLCLSCHKRTEHAVAVVEQSGASTSDIGFVFSLLLRHRQAATAAVLRRLSNEC